MRSPGASFDLRAALAKEVESAIAELQDASPAPKSVHRCRVHLKRARALARIGRLCAPGLAGVFNDSARRVVHTLGAARDLVALSETARALATISAKKPGLALAAIADALDRARHALAPTRWESVRAALRDLLAMAQVWPEASPRQIEKGAVRLVRRARDACADGHGARTAALRHEWRKREKDRFYAVELLGKAWPQDCPRRRKRGLDLGHALGQERDLLLLIERIDDDPHIAGGAKAAKRARRVLRRRCRKHAAQADRAGAALHRNGA